MDSTKILVGLSGHKAVPTTISIKAPETFIQRGSIRNWELARKAWHRAFDSLVITSGNQKGLIVALPSNCTQHEIERMVDAVFTEFPIMSVFVINPWMAVMVNANRRTAMVVLAEEGATVIAAVVGMKLEAQSVIHLPVGIRDLPDSDKVAMQRYIESVQAVCCEL